MALSYTRIYMRYRLASAIGFAMLTVQLGLAQWYPCAPIPSPTYLYSWAHGDSLLYYGGGLYGNSFNASSGFHKINVFEYWVPNWTSLAPLTSPRFGSGMAVAPSGKVYIFGGWTPSGNGVYQLVEEYDPQTNTWTSKSPMPTGRVYPQAITSNGLIYVMGGCDSNSIELSVVEAYDPVNDTWSAKAPMPQPACFFGATKGNAIYGQPNGNYIYVSGGYQYNANWVLNNVSSYNVLTNTWAALPNLPYRVYGHGMTCDAIGTLFISGGQRWNMFNFFEEDRVFFSDHSTNYANWYPYFSLPRKTYFGQMIGYLTGGNTPTQHLRIFGGASSTLSLTFNFNEETRTWTVLPQEELHLTAKSEGTIVTLEWDDVSTEVAYYQVERASNLLSFAPIGEKVLPGQHFSLIDHSPQPGSNNYRLKIIQNDGRIQYSSSVEVVCAQKQLQVWLSEDTQDKIYFLHYRIPENETKLEMRLLDYNGRFISQGQLLNNESPAMLDLTMLSSGMYFVVVSTKTETRTVKVFIH